MRNNYDGIGDKKYNNGHQGVQKYNIGHQGIQKYDIGHQGVQKHGPRSELSLTLPSLVVLHQPVL